MDAQILKMDSESYSKKRKNYGRKTEPLANLGNDHLPKEQSSLLSDISAHSEIPQGTFISSEAGLDELQRSTKSTEGNSTVRVVGVQQDGVVRRQQRQRLSNPESFRNGVAGTRGGGFQQYPRQTHGGHPSGNHRSRQQYRRAGSWGVAPSNRFHQNDYGRSHQQRGGARSAGGTGGVPRHQMGQYHRNAGRGQKQDQVEHGAAPMYGIDHDAELSPCLPPSADQRGFGYLAQHYHNYPFLQESLDYSQTCEVEGAVSVLGNARDQNGFVPQAEEPPLGISFQPLQQGSTMVGTIPEEETLCMNGLPPTFAVNNSMVMLEKVWSNVGDETVSHPSSSEPTVPGENVQMLQSSSDMIQERDCMFHTGIQPKIMDHAGQQPQFLLSSVHDNFHPSANPAVILASQPTGAPGTSMTQSVHQTPYASVFFPVMQPTAGEPQQEMYSNQAMMTGNAMYAYGPAPVATAAQPISEHQGRLSLSGQQLPLSRPSNSFDEWEMTSLNSLDSDVPSYAYLSSFDTTASTPSAYPCDGRLQAKHLKRSFSALGSLAEQDSVVESSHGGGSPTEAWYGLSRCLFSCYFGLRQLTLEGKEQSPAEALAYIDGHVAALMRFADQAHINHRAANPSCVTDTFMNCEGQLQELVDTNFLAPLPMPISPVITSLSKAAESASPYEMPWKMAMAAVPASTVEAAMVGATKWLDLEEY